MKKRTDLEEIQDKFSGDQLDRAIWQYFRLMNPSYTDIVITEMFESYTGRKYKFK